MSGAWKPVVMMGVKREAGVVRDVVAGPLVPARKGAVK